MFNISKLVGRYSLDLQSSAEQICLARQAANQLVALGYLNFQQHRQLSLET